MRCERETYETPGSDWVSCPVSQSIRFFLHLFLFFFATVSYFLALIFSLFDRVSLTFITFPYMTQSSLFLLLHVSPSNQSQPIRKDFWRTKAFCGAESNRIQIMFTTVSAALFEYSNLLNSTTIIFQAK